MIRRARLLAVVVSLVVGTVSVISSTQTWLVAALDGEATLQLAVSGAEALPVLAPLGLAVLALGAALSIVGIVLRFAFGVLTVGIAAILAVLSAQIAVSVPVSAVASAVTTATGITGDDAVATLVTSVSATPWPAVTLVAGILLLADGVFILATARNWSGSGRRFTAEPVPEPASPGRGAGEIDAIDSWDDLSRGEDPTASPR